jgi:cellulose synthase/poly-beta-1,6-N-acetylglucosamine synthase-like glycosyltransferase
MNKQDNSLHRIAIVILAQNESIVIQSTVGLVREALRENDALFVIADNCLDDTAVLAKEAGARVFLRNDASPQGKGAALSWFLQNHPSLMDYSYLVILDADSRIDNNFLETLETQLDNHIIAAQCFLSPVDYEDNPLSTIIALSEILEQTVFDRLRSLLGWTIRLRGTGMVIKPQLLLEVSKLIDTEVEDIVMSLLLAERHVVVKPLPSVVVYDPKPIETEAAARQRARWFRGQFAAFWKHRSIILGLLLRGPSGWSVISSLFFKPRWLEIALLTVIGLAFIEYPVVAAIFLGLVLIEGISILVGILKVPGKWKFLKALFFIPSFVLMWIKGILLSMRRSTWLRARTISRSSDEIEPNTSLHIK